MNTRGFCYGFLIDRSNMRSCSGLSLTSPSFSSNIDSINEETVDAKDDLAASSWISISCSGRSSETMLSMPLIWPSIRLKRL